MLLFYLYFIFIIQALENLLLGRPPRFFEITANLKEMDVTERPVHCTDKKRETIYIKDQDKWEKENEVAQGNQENRSEELQVASSL
jgi:hypothetical protein